jgi:hypothetical protein
MRGKVPVSFYQYVTVSSGLPLAFQLFSHGELGYTWGTGELENWRTGELENWRTGELERFSSCEMSDLEGNQKVRILLGRMLAEEDDEISVSPKHSQVWVKKHGWINYKYGLRQPPIVITGKAGTGKSFSMRHITRIMSVRWGSSRVLEWNVCIPSSSPWEIDSQIDGLRYTQPSVLLVDLETGPSHAQTALMEMIQKISVCAYVYLVVFMNATSVPLHQLGIHTENLLCRGQLAVDPSDLLRAYQRCVRGRASHREQFTALLRVRARRFFQLPMDCMRVIYLHLPSDLSHFYGCHRCLD